MPNTIPQSTIDKFTTFGDLLRYLRRRAGITQMDLSIAVGYSDPQISRLEQNLRLPDIPTIEARFIIPLGLEDEPRAVARLLELAAIVRREDAPALGLCPYKGLDYFDEADSDLFVGRESLTEKLVDIVLALVSSTLTNLDRFLAIVGASGNGKSSLVRAGLVPALRWNQTSSNWPIHVLTPTAHPLESLANALSNNNVSLASVASLMDDLARDQRTLNLYIKRELKTNPGSYLLLVIDQFEELFTLCSSEDERLAFISNLLTAATEPDGQAIVIITLHADFYAHCASYLQLRKALARQQEYIGAMSDEEMRRAIEEPARRGRWEFEPGLVDLFLHDVGHEPGALPLLSHALLETWQRRQGRKLSLSGYTSSGGVRGAIAETAEAVFTDQFTHEQQTITRRIFLRLTELGDETATGDTRRLATFNELIPSKEEAVATQTVIKALADARLITTSEDSVQVAHEALIREWPTLRGWLEDNREGLRLHRHLTEASQEWSAMEHEPDLLYRGARLAQAREWAATNSDDMNTLEKEFLEASIESSEWEAAEREAQHQRELDTAQKLADNERQREEEKVKSAQRLRRRSILVSAVGVLAILLVIFGVYAWQRSASQITQNRSQELASAAQQANQAGQGDLALALEAVKMKPPSTGAVTALRAVALGSGTRAVLTGHNQAVRSVAFSPDALKAISGSCAQIDTQGACRTGELILWDLNTQNVLHRWSAHNGWVTAVAFSSDGQTIISGAEDGSLILWDKNGEQIRQLAGHIGSITDLAILPDTGLLLSGSADGFLILWELRTGERLQVYQGTFIPITSLAVAANKLIAVSAHQDGSLQLWNLYKSRPIQHFENQGAAINSVAISPDGSWILFTNSAEPDLFLRMIDSSSGLLIKQQVFSAMPDNLALSPDATYALVACDSVIYQVDMLNWSVQNIFMESSDDIDAIAISRDGRMGLSASKDGKIRLWNLARQLDYQIINITSDHLNAIAVSSDGRYLLLNDTSKNGIERPALWDNLQKTVVINYFGFYGVVSPAAAKISPDDRFAAIAGFQEDANHPTVITPTVMLWSLHYTSPFCHFVEFTAPGRALAFSPDSHYLLAGSQDPINRSGQLIMLDVQTCQPVRQFDNNEDVTSIAFSGDGTRAITGSDYDGRVTLWDVSTGKEIKHFFYLDNGPVLSVAFGPSDSTILGSGLTSIFLWDVETGNIKRRYSGLTAFPWSVAISSDGKYVLAGTLNGDLILWDFSTGEELRRIIPHLGILNVLFSPDGKTAYAASLDGKLVEWQVTEKSYPSCSFGSAQTSIPAHSPVRRSSNITSRIPSVSSDLAYRRTYPVRF